MMLPVPYAAFGHVVFLCTADAGSKIVTPLTKDGAYAAGLYYIISGRSEVTVVETGERLQDRTAGWLNSEKNSIAATTGNIQCLYPEETRWVCVPYVSNPKGVPSVTSLLVEEGQSENFENGSNIFLVDGQLSIGEKTFTGPTQIRVRKGDVVATALNRVLALRFPTL
jgi:hypothetical protein